MVLSAAIIVVSADISIVESAPCAETGAVNIRATARRANNCFMVKMWVVVVSLCANLQACEGRI
jgi:hypothetical protein